MTLRRTFHTAWTSYAGLASALLAGLLTLRFATGTLTPEEFGLWSFTTQSVGYFLLLDFGVSSSLGRLFGEPLGSGDQRRINSWFTMAILVLSFQGVVVVGAGLLLRDWVVTWFGIPEHLRGQATTLWLAILIIQAVSLPLRVSSAILFAQNRAYWANLFPVVNAWVGLSVFALMLQQGFGVIAFAWSAGTGVLLGGTASAVAVCLGPHRFAFRLRDVEWRQFRELFSFASAVFLIGIAIQVSFASQTLIITKVLGLAAAAMYTVSSRLPMLCMQLIWKPFDSFTPRWQTSYCAGDSERVTREFALLFRISALLGGVAAIGIVLFNPAFIRWWTQPDFFAGYELNALLAVFVFVQTLTHCLSYAFNLRKRMRFYSAVVVATTIVGLGAMILLVGRFGLIGIPLGMIAADLVFSFWFHLIHGGRLLGIAPVHTLSIEVILIAPLFGAALLLSTWPLSFGSAVAGVLVGAGLAMLLSLPLLGRVAVLAREVHRVRHSSPVA